MIPEDMDDFMLWKIIITIMSEPEPRKKLSHVNTFQDVISLLHTCQNIMVLTGAGVRIGLSAFGVLLLAIKQGFTLIFLIR